MFTLLYMLAKRRLRSPLPHIQQIRVTVALSSRDSSTTQLTVTDLPFEEAYPHHMDHLQRDPAPAA